MFDPGYAFEQLGSAQDQGATNFAFKMREAPRVVREGVENREIVIAKAERELGGRIRFFQHGCKAVTQEGFDLVAFSVLSGETDEQCLHDGCIVLVSHWSNP